MEIRSISFVAALICACISGSALAYLCGSLLVEKLRNQRAISRSGVEGSLFASCLRQGIALFDIPARILARISYVAAYAKNLESAVLYCGYQTTQVSLLSLLCGVVLIVLIGAMLISHSVVCGIAMAICVVLGGALWANRQNEHKQMQLREAIPEALQSMKACFQVGYSLSQTIREVRQHTKGPLSDLFRDIEGVLETGGSAEQALSVLKQQTSEPELVFLATALEIQHKTGSSMEQVLEITRQSIQDEIELKRTLRTQTAQAKLSAQIVTIMPFALIGLFSLVSPGFLDPFFESVIGLFLLVLALGMQALGIVLVRRLLKVEVI